jgi:hypothetical protein
MKKAAKFEGRAKRALTGSSKSGAAKTKAPAKKKGPVSCMRARRWLATQSLAAASSACKESSRRSEACEARAVWVRDRQAVALALCI